MVRIRICILLAACALIAGCARTLTEPGAAMPQARERWMLGLDNWELNPDLARDLGLPPDTTGKLIGPVLKGSRAD